MSSAAEVPAIAGCGLKAGVQSLEGNQRWRG
jgi:hypothetical protein